MPGVYKVKVDTAQRSIAANGYRFTCVRSHACRGRVMLRACCMLGTQSIFTNVAVCHESGMLTHQRLCIA
jgi:hypothetical protein